jgi:hypothetical protein
VLEQLVQPRDRLVTVDPRLADLGPGQVGDRAAAIRDAVQPVVVERDHDAVAGRVQVGLQVPVAEVDGVLEGVQGVLVPDVVRVLRAAPMRHRDRSVVVEVLVHA